MVTGASWSHHRPMGLDWPDASLWLGWNGSRTLFQYGLLTGIAELLFVLANVLFAALTVQCGSGLATGAALPTARPATATLCLYQGTREVRCRLLLPACTAWDRAKRHLLDGPLTGLLQLSRPHLVLEVGSLLLDIVKVLMSQAVVLRSGYLLSLLSMPAPAVVLDVDDFFG